MVEPRRYTVFKLFRISEAIALLCCVLVGTSRGVRLS